MSPDQPGPRPDRPDPTPEPPDPTPGQPDLGQVRAELEARRDRTRERVATLAKRPERGSSLGFGKRIGDGTTEAIGRLTDIGVGGELEHSLARTERALAKLDEGTYGICDSCGEPISPGRLRALPDGVLCLECSSKAPRPRPTRRR
jgi:DnaK suppressor protein